MSSTVSALSIVMYSQLSFAEVSSGLEVKGRLVLLHDRLNNSNRKIIYCSAIKYSF